MPKQNDDSFLPPHGGYKHLRSFQKAEIIYDGTVFFCNKFFGRYDRTKEQMIQAARSGKQNIAEGSMISATSKEGEIKLTNVARASLDELKNDYEDFLRVRGLKKWKRNDRLSVRFDELNSDPDANYETFKVAIEHSDPEISANVLLCLTRLTIYLLGRQLTALEVAFVNDGGMRERMFNARLKKRKEGEGGAENKT